MVDTRCKLCSLQSESICHVLYQCPCAYEFFEGAEVHVPVDGFSDSLEENMRFLLDCMEDATVSEIVRQKIPWIVWTIWKNRNSILLANKQEAVASQVQRATEEAMLWLKVNVHDRQLTSSAALLTREKWQTPPQGYVKCNIHSNWRNASLHVGGAWIVRDPMGNVLFHAREAFTCSTNKILAELNCIRWALQSIRDLRVNEVICVSDCAPAVEALLKPSQWPRYRLVTEAILTLCSEFESCSFELEAPSTNFVAREIAKSVLRDGRFQSYLSLGGPAWLADRIALETS